MMIYIEYGYRFPSTKGLQKKMIAMTKSFAKVFDSVMRTYCAYGIVYLFIDEKIVEKAFAITKEEQFKVFMYWIEKYRVNKAYIRYHTYFDLFTIDFLRDLKRNKIQTVLEFPDFPYEDQIQNPLVRLEDQVNRDKLKDYLSLVTVYAKYRDIYGVPAVILQNGVDIDDHPLRHVRKKGKNITLLFVGHMLSNHGLERIIKGIKKYYDGTRKNYEIKMVAVGNGLELEKYKALSREEGLESNIQFVGEKEGEDLNYYYNKADIGIGSLGMYKINLHNGSPIKLREYCARGLPFIYGYDDIGFSGNEIYCSQVPNDDTPLDMDVVIDLYERTVDNQDIINSMRKYAETALTWDALLKPVIEYYNKQS